MALKLVTKTQHWIGTAAERVAMVTTDVSVGSTFEETDTGLIYKWSGSAWFVGSSETVAMTEADGANVALGAKNDAAATVGDATPFSVISLLKGIYNKKRSSTAPAATPVTVDTTVGGTILIAANANRISVTLQNVSTEPCIIRLGGNPSTSAYNAVIAEDSSLRSGGGGCITITDFTGEIKGITEANSTVIAVTEVV